jgi:hypothetical protein
MPYGCEPWNGMVLSSLVLLPFATEPLSVAEEGISRDLVSLNSKYNHWKEGDK